MNFKKTEIGQIPEDWYLKKIGDFSKLITGNTPSKKNKDFWADGKIEFIKPPDLQNRLIDTFSEKISDEAKEKARIVDKGAILVSCIGNIGRVGYADHKVAFNQQINSVIPTKETDNLYLFYALQFHKTQIQNLASFTTVPIVSKSKFSEVKISLPPLPEQKKIAAVLSAVQEAKEKTEAVIEATKTLKKSMMKHLFTYGPVSVKEADKVDVVNFEVGEIPSSWETAKIEEYYNFSRKPKNIDILANKELPFIPMEGISNNSKSCSWIKKIKSDISSGTFVFKNDLIVAKITPSFENGKQAILYNLPNEYGYATTEVWALHSKDESSLNEYLYEYLKLPVVRKEIAGKMEGSTGRQRVSRGVISNTMFPKPTLKEQRDIVNILDKIDSKIKSTENKKQALEKLFQSLLKNLMTGKLRVNDIDIPL